MKMWTGIITPKLAESRSFYVDSLKAEVVFESSWFVLLRLGGSQLGLMLPELESQAPMFQAPISGPGMWLAFDVDGVDRLHDELQQAGVEIALSIRTEPWGDRHFVVLDPNGVGVDFVQHLTT